MAQLDEKIKAGFASFGSHIKSKLKKGRDRVVEKTARTNKLSPYEKQVLLFLIWFELHINGSRWKYLRKKPILYSARQVNARLSSE